MHDLRAVPDHKNNCYHVESVRGPNVFWMNLADMDFAAGKPTKRLTLTEGAIYAGNASARFQLTEHFKLLPAMVRKR